MIQLFRSCAPTLSLFAQAGNDGSWHVRLMRPIVLDATALSSKLTVFVVPKQLGTVHATVFFTATGATFLKLVGTVTAAVARAFAFRSPNVAPRSAAKNLPKVPGADWLVTTLMQLYGGLVEQDEGGELGGTLTDAVTPLKLFCAYVLATDTAPPGSDGSAWTPASAAASAAV